MPDDPVLLHLRKLEHRAWACVRVALPILLLVALVAVPIRYYLDPGWADDARGATIPASLTFSAIAGLERVYRLTSSTRRRAP